MPRRHLTQGSLDDPETVFRALAGSREHRFQRAAKEHALCRRFIMGVDFIAKRPVETIFSTWGVLIFFDVFRRVTSTETAALNVSFLTLAWSVVIFSGLSTVYRYARGSKKTNPASYQTYLEKLEHYPVAANLDQFKRRVITNPQTDNDTAFFIDFHTAHIAYLSRLNEWEHIRYLMTSVRRRFGVVSDKAFLYFRLLSCLYRLRMGRPEPYATVLGHPAAQYFLLQETSDLVYLNLIERDTDLDQVAERMVNEFVISDSEDFLQPWLLIPVLKDLVARRPNDPDKKAFFLKFVETCPLRHVFQYLPVFADVLPINDPNGVNKLHTWLALDPNNTSTDRLIAMLIFALHPPAMLASYEKSRFFQQQEPYWFVKEVRDILEMFGREGRLNASENSQIAAHLKDFGLNKRRVNALREAANKDFVNFIVSKA